MRRLRLIIHQQARLRRRTREHGLLTPERPLSSQAHLQSFPKSRSVENLVSAPLRAPFPGSADNPGEDVDYGDSDEHSPPSPARAGSISGTSTPTAQPSHTGGAASIIQEDIRCHPTKGVILVSEAFTEINAGLFIILASGHESPIAEADLADPNRDPDEIAALVVQAYHEHVEGDLATTRPPHNTEEAVSRGLLGSPLLGTRTRAAADWCHAGGERTGTMVWLGDIPSTCNGRVAETWPLERNIEGLPKETAQLS